MTLVRLDTHRITDWSTFHEVFADAFGFPEFYGRNMDAWINCMASLDSPADGMTRVHAVVGGVVALHLDHADDFARRCPEQYEALVQSAGFVNGRRIETGGAAVIALSFLRDR